MAVVKEETLSGQTVTFHVTDEGTFYATADVLVDTKVRGATLVACRGKIATRLRRLAINLEIKAHRLNLPRPEIAKKPEYQRTREDNEVPTDHIEPVFLTGINAHNGAVMFVNADTGEKEEDGSRWSQGYDEAIFARRLTDAEVQKYKELHAAKTAAENAFKAFIGLVKIENVTDYVANEVEKRFAAGAPTLAETETDDPRIDDRPKRKTFRR